MSNQHGSRDKLRRLALEGCDREVTVLDFEPFEAERHVVKHVLNTDEGWDHLLGADTGEVRAALRALACLGTLHGRDCPRFPECQAKLAVLVARYRGEVLRALSEGAERPRHVHETERGVQAGNPSLLFLSDVGVIVRTYPDSRDRAPLRSGYRKNQTGRPLASDAEYLRAAKEYVCRRYRGYQNGLCLAETWGCGRLTSLGEAFKAARTRHGTP